MSVWYPTHSRSVWETQRADRKKRVVAWRRHLLRKIHIRKYVCMYASMYMCIVHACMYIMLLCTVFAGGCLMHVYIYMLN